MEGSSHDQLEVLSRHLHRETEENTKILQQDLLRPGGNSNPMPSEYNDEALPLELFCPMALILIT
jgi:hypothetical protein